MDLQILMDLWIYGFEQIFGFNYGYGKTTLPARVISHFMIIDRITAKIYKRSFKFKLKIESEI